MATTSSDSITKRFVIEKRIPLNGGWNALASFDTFMEAGLDKLSRMSAEDRGIRIYDQVDSEVVSDTYS